MITPGAKPLLYYGIVACVDPGDEVIYPNPGFPTYESVIRFVGGVPVPMPLWEERDFRPDLEELRRLVTPRTRMIILNSPNNPTGGVLDRADLEAIAGMAIARQRPATANGIVFMLLEDEHGQANLILPPQVYEQHRAIVRGEPLLLARGKLERSGRNVNLLVSRITSLGPLARKAASEAEVTRALPRAHHFGHR